MNYYAPEKKAYAARAKRQRKPAPPTPQPSLDPCRQGGGRTREQLDEGRCYAGL